MKNGKIIGLLLAAAVAQGCGERGDPEGGTLFRVNSITADSTDINTTCTESGGLTLFQKTDALVEFESKTLNTGDDVDVTINEYEIEYIPLDGGPELSSHDYPFILTKLVPGNGKLSTNVEFVPINTKKQYRNATTGTTSFTKISLYQAHYIFRGTTEYDVKVEAEGDISFALGNNYIVTCEAQ